VSQFIFVESSCEQGNAGSPLVNAETGEVIGVMVDCPPSPAESHTRLKGIINENIRMLDRVAGRWKMGEIDPAQVLTANLHMIKHLAREIYLSSHRNYGFALPSGRLSRYLKDLEHRNQISAGNIASGK
jgi:S1-C subfamily serine protease